MAIAHAPPRLSLDDQQHIVLEDMSWDFYERLLEEIGDRSIRVTFDEGRLEIMSPLPRHERYELWIAFLVQYMCAELDINVVPLGSTTFRHRAKKKGLEPDGCFYVQSAAKAAKLMDAFDARTDPPPDLAIEIDITHRSVDREPIYAALKVSELWRFDGKRLHVLHLSRGGKYSLKPKSLAFPFLPMTEFETFISRVTELNRNAVLTEFRHWLAKLPKSKQS